MKLRRELTTFVFVLLATSAAHAHGNEIHEQAGMFRNWTWEPVSIIALLLTAILYTRGLLVMRRSAAIHSIRAWQIASFAAGWCALVLALLSPIHKLGGQLFWVHMTQHELLMLLCAPLLVMGRPLVVFLWALPMASRAAAGRISKRRAIAATWLLLTSPLLVWLLHGVTLWIWHAPALYQASVNDEFVHALQHSTFFGTALLFWWTLTQGRHGRLTYGSSLLYVFTTMLHSGVLGALITLTPQLWYPVYSGRSERFGISALEDQQLGGLIMWVPSGLVFLVILLALFCAWLGESERRSGYSRLARLLEGSGGAQ